MNVGSLTRILSACAGPQAISYTMEFCGLLLSNDIGLCYGHKSYAEHVTMAAQSACSMDSAYRTSLEPSYCRSGGHHISLCRGRALCGSHHWCCCRADHDPHVKAAEAHAN